MVEQIDQSFEAIVHASSDSIIVVDHEGIIQFVNPAAEMLFERSREELLGTMFGSPVVAGEITELDIVRKGDSAVAEMRVGKLLWKNQPAYLAILRDITYTRKAQQELQSLYNAVSYLFKADDLHKLGHQIASAVVQEFHHVDCGVLLLDKTRGKKITRLARAGQYQIDAHTELVLDGSGLVPEALRTKKIIYVPDVSVDPRYLSGHQQTRSELVIPLQANNSVIGALDLQSTRLNGFQQGQQRVLVAFAERAAAAIDNMQLYSQVTQHKVELEWRVALRTADLARSNERMEVILNNVSDAIILANANMMILQTNPAFFDLFGWTMDELQGVYLSNIFKDNLSVLKEAFHKAQKDNLTYSIEVTGKRKDGSQVIAEMALAPVTKTLMHETHVICSLRDITERKQMEEELRHSLAREKELNELRTMFVSMASHEFRTPLASMSSSADLLATYRRKMDDAEIDEKLNGIVEQVRHLTAIMDDVLSLGRLQSTRTEFDPAEFNLDELFHSVIQEFQDGETASSAIHYQCNQRPFIVYLDKTLIRQVINNLISNAKKYTPAEKAIFITLTQQDEAILFQVRDEGIGIPHSERKHLFEPFFRAGNVGKIPGTGLGLSITKQAIEMHNGTITVCSELHVGTTFSIHIPHRRR